MYLAYEHVNALQLRFCTHIIGVYIWESLSPCEHLQTASSSRPKCFLLLRPTRPISYLRSSRAELFESNVAGTHSAWSGNGREQGTLSFGRRNIYISSSSSSSFFSTSSHSSSIAWLSWCGYFFIYCMYYYWTDRKKARDWVRGRAMNLDRVLLSFLMAVIAKPNSAICWAN